MSSEQIEALLKEFQDAVVNLHVMWGLPENDSWKVNARKRFQESKKKLVAALS